jgi:thiol peroxidase
MTERNNVTTFQGNPLTLVGDELSVGQQAPDCQMLDAQLNPVKLSSYKGKVCIACSVPSLDTPVCDTEVRRFNTEAAALGNDIQIIVVSMDLPFAQARWCGAAEVDNLITLSDYRDADFANAFGLLIKELRLLARAVYIIDKAGTVAYAQILDDITKEPDYDAAIEAAKNLVD